MENKQKSSVQAFAKYVFLFLFEMELKQVLVWKSNINSQLKLLSKCCLFPIWNGTKNSFTIGKQKKKTKKLSGSPCQRCFPPFLIWNGTENMFIWKTNLKKQLYRLTKAICNNYACTRKWLVFVFQISSNEKLFKSSD